MALPRASALDTAGVLSDVVVPLVGRGVIIRRPRVVGLLERADADARAVRRMQRLRDRYGPGPVMLAIPGRNVAMVLAPEHVKQILDQSPEPFATANREKRAALSHFQPHGVLISHGESRTERRHFNEQVLDFHRPEHRFAEDLVAKVDDEFGRLTGTLDWDAFAIAWWRVVRRVVLGDAARDDDELTDLLARLRGDANWAFMKPKRTQLRQRFLVRLQQHLDRAEGGSLAALVQSVAAGPSTHPTEQVPQWLFAFDAAGMATFRALALLASHPDRVDRAALPACVLESVRLWPTTPAILRDSTTETEWDHGRLPSGSALVIFAPFFHRDDTRLPFADSFAPEVWLDPGSAEEWPLVPFSAGPGECAGRNLVLLLTSATLARLIAGGLPQQRAGARLDPQRPLPRTLSPFRLSFSLAS
jgi:cytochrome P450